MWWKVKRPTKSRPQVAGSEYAITICACLTILCLYARSQATAQVVPPAVLQFRKWLTIWSGESAKLQDANERKRHAAILEDGLKPKLKKMKSHGSHWNFYCHTRRACRRNRINDQPYLRANVAGSGNRDYNYNKISR